MVEYIERNKVIQLLRDACSECKDGYMEFDGLLPDCAQCIMGKYRVEISRLPVADVQPVVRCKDCQYWQESRYGIIEMNACLRFDSPLEKDGFIFKANAEDFCSFAKRRAET